MQTYKFFLVILALAISQIVVAQPSFSAENVIQSALKNSLLVKSAEARVEQAEFKIKGGRSPHNPQLEIAPGFGFTNSHAILSQELDLFGRRSAYGRLYASQAKMARSHLLGARIEVVSEALQHYSGLIWAQENLAFATRGESGAKLFAQAVRRRVEIGEAPEVHFTRSEVEMAMAQQMRIEAESLLQSSLIALNSLIGRPLESVLVAREWADSEVSGVPASMEVLLAEGELDIAKAQLFVTQVSTRPRLTAGIASDIWSLDRDSMGGEQFGFQMNLSLPLFDLGESRFAVKAAQATIDQHETRLRESERLALVRYEHAIVKLNSAKKLRDAFDGEIIPKGLSMVTAMKSGYESGLITLLEVLESQQAFNRLYREKLTAEKNFRLTQIDVMKATHVFLAWR